MFRWSKFGQDLLYTGGGYMFRWSKFGQDLLYTGGGYVFRWSKFGQDLLYTGGGYVQELGTSFNQTLDVLQQLADAHWLDRR